MPAPTDVAIDVYDNSDKSLMDWLAFMTYRDKIVPKVFATPDRAFAVMAKSMGFGTEGDALKAIPRPFISVNNTSIAQAQDRYSRAKEKKAQVLDSNGAVIADPAASTDWKTYRGYEWPQGVNLTYQIEYWAQTRAQLMLANSQWAKKFRCNETFMTCHHPEIFGDRLIPIVWDDCAYNSVLEPGEPDRITLRLTFICTVKAWIPRATEETKVVRKVVSQGYLSDDLVTEDVLVFEDEEDKDEDGIG